MSLVFLFARTLSVNHTSDSGIFLFLILCRSFSVTAFGKVPLMTRNRVETVLRDRQAFLTVASRR
jgi:hypothetical protein